MALKSILWNTSLVLGCCLATQTFAHTPSSSHITLETSRQIPHRVVIDLEMVDVLSVIDLDSDANNQVTWREVVRAEPQLVGFISRGLRILNGEKTCPLSTDHAKLSMVRMNEVTGVRIALPVLCVGAPDERGYRLSDRLFFDAIPTHRTLLRVVGDAGDSAFVLTNENREQSIPGGTEKFSGLSGFVVAGFQHIMAGYDHLMFLLLLILPVAGTGSLRERLVQIGVIVTAFTAAHSVTLSAVAMDIVHLPPKPVEVAIALSIVLAALLNLLRPLHSLGWKIAFAFGLLHGFGFASALSDLDLASRTLWLSLLAFNFGIEVGQLAVVALVLPMLGLISMSTRYQSQFVPAMSIAAAAIGTIWTFGRI